jgi:hypothetical protein
VLCCSGCMSSTLAPLSMYRNLAHALQEMGATDVQLIEKGQKLANIRAHVPFQGLAGVRTGGLSCVEVKVVLSCSWVILPPMQPCWLTAHPFAQQLLGS